MTLPTITAVGRLTSDPDLRFLPNGTPTASFSIACNDRKKNAQTGEWEDGDATFLNCQVWRQYAENAAESLTRGMEVQVSGKLRQRKYTNRENVEVTVMEVDVEDVGPTLRWATAKVARTSSGQGQTRTQQPRQQQPAADPWANAQPAAQADPWSQPSAIPQDQPPF